jgi:signal transduction histidine kinase
MSSTTIPQASQAPAPHDPFYLIAESTAAEVGGEFLAALVRSMHEAMDVSVAVITRGIGEPPVRARAAFSWKKAGSAFPDEYDLEGTPCSVVYKGQRLVLPEQLWRRFPREAGKEGYCGVPLRNGAGKVVGHFSVFSDVPIRNPQRTEGIMRIFGMRVEAELQRIDAEQERAALIQRLSEALERLGHQHQLTRRANAFKTEMLGMVAHDLRNPLAAIVGRAELIERLFEGEAGPGDTKLRERVQTACTAIGRAADRMEGMIADLLVSARNEARSISLRCSKVDLGEPVRVAIGLNQRAAEAKGIRIAEVAADTGTTILADADRLIEAVDNLLSNAIKYSPVGGAVRVEAGIEAATGLAWVSVADRGEGMTENDIAQAFQRFQPLSAKPTAGESSTGLGLAIVRAIAEAHGGSVEAASPGKGQGATFTLRLPPSGPRPA